MKLYKDYIGKTIRLTDERFVHILEHPEMTEVINITPGQEPVKNKMDLSKIDLSKLDFNTMLNNAYLDYLTIVTRYPELGEILKPEKLVAGVKADGTRFLLVPVGELIPDDMKDKITKGKFNKLLKLVRGIL